MILVTGSTGTLGRELSKEFPDSLRPTHQELDITDQVAINKYIETYQPSIIIHAAALTDVKKCEVEKALAWKINADGTGNLVDALLSYAPKSYLVYISTASVFKCDEGNYSEEDKPSSDQVNFYNWTKFIGEHFVRKIPMHLIVRTNFVNREKWKYPRAFIDRFANYLFADQVAFMVRRVIEKRMTGVVHIVGDKQLSMFEVAKMTCPDVKPLTLEEYYKTESLRLPKNMTLRSTRVSPWNIHEPIPKTIQ